MADPSPIKAPGTLAYSIANQPETVHDLLLQKRDGTFALVVWDEKPQYLDKKGVPVLLPVQLFPEADPVKDANSIPTLRSDKITASFAGKLPLVNVYDPTTGTQASQRLTDVSSIKLTLSDHPVILDIRRR